MIATERWLRGRAAARARRGHGRTTALVPAALDLASNDYLGLASDPAVLAAAHAALDRDGAGARASRVVTGTTAAHLALEDALVTLTGHPSALATSTGYAANLAALGALGGAGTLILLDVHAHASLRDGAALARGRAMEFPHDDLDAARVLLGNRAEPRAIVVIESVYSVLGDAPDLAAWARLCAEHDALLLVDDAHGIGVLGAGRGGVAAAGLAGRDDVVVTLSCGKALGAQGGAVLASTLIREAIVSTGRAFIYDAGLAPAAAAAAAAAADRIRRDPALVARLHECADAIADAAQVPRAAGAVQSIAIADAVRALAITQELRDAGVLIGCFRPPSTPDGVSRLRLTARASVPPADAATAAARIRRLIEEEGA